jgi:hypothetical protein
MSSSSGFAPPISLERIKKCRSSNFAQAISLERHFLYFRLRQISRKIIAQNSVHCRNQTFAEGANQRGRGFETSTTFATQDLAFTI